MSNVPNITGKEAAFRLDQAAAIEELAHALGTELRLRIIRLVGERPQSVAELAHELDIPVSTCSLNVQVLENARLLRCEKQPGQRGTMKICSRRLDRVTFDLQSLSQTRESVQTVEMPIGGYSVAGDVTATCGFADDTHCMPHYDVPRYLQHPEHFRAGLVWMHSGYLEYTFPPIEALDELKFLEISFEACAEAPGYSNDWPSDIYVELNGCELGVWRCTGDFGGRRGVNTPQWWSELDTQFGQLTTWRVTPTCTKLNGEYLSSASLSDLRLTDGENVRLRIGVHENAEFVGGLNLFGRHFGDYAQDIVFRTYYDTENME